MMNRGPPNPIRVSIAGQSRLFLESLARALDTYEGLTVLQCADGDEGLDCLSEACPDVVLVEACFTPTPFLRLTRLRIAFERARIVAVGLESDVETLVTAIQAGANAYVLRDASLDELVQTIRDAVEERTRIDPTVATAVLARLQALMSPHPAVKTHNVSSLSTRELQVLKLVGQGLLNKEISRVLGISLSTVKNHVHRILRKLGVTNRRQAVNHLVHANGVALVGPTAEPRPSLADHELDPK